MSYKVFQEARKIRDKIAPLKNPDKMFEILNPYIDEDAAMNEITLRKAIRQHIGEIPPIFNKDIKRIISNYMNERDALKQHQDFEYGDFMDDCKERKKYDEKTSTGKLKIIEICKDEWKLKKLTSELEPEPEPGTFSKKDIGIFETTTIIDALKQQCNIKSLQKEVNLAVKEKNTFKLDTIFNVECGDNWKFTGAKK